MRALKNIKKSEASKALQENDGAYVEATAVEAAPFQYKMLFYGLWCGLIATLEVVARLTMFAPLAAAAVTAFVGNVVIAPLGIIPGGRLVMNLLRGALLGVVGWVIVGCRGYFLGVFHKDRILSLLSILSFLVPILFQPRELMKYKVLNWNLGDVNWFYLAGSLLFIHFVTFGIRGVKGTILRVKAMGDASLENGDTWRKEGGNEGDMAEFNNRFERACAEALEAAGFKAVVSGTQMAKERIKHKGPGDGGVDIFAHRAGEFFVVSCKRYKDNVPEKDVANILSRAVDERFTSGKVASIIGFPGWGKGRSTPALITTTGFSPAGIETAKRNGIHLYTLSDRNVLVRVV